MAVTHVESPASPPLSHLLGTSTHWPLPPPCKREPMRAPTKGYWDNPMEQGAQRADGTVPAHVSIVKWEVVSVQQQKATPSPGTCTLMVVRLQGPATGSVWEVWDRVRALVFLPHPLQ